MTWARLGLELRQGTQTMHRSAARANAHPARGRRSRRRPFTLIEILSVISIMLVLAGILLSVSAYVSRRSAIARTRSLTERLSMALEACRIDRGYYPQHATPVDVNLRQNGTSPYGPFEPFKSSQTGAWYLEGSPLTPDASGDIILRDAWGAPLQYRCPGTHNTGSYDLWSKGPDGQTGSSDTDADDVTNWKRD